MNEGDLETEEPRARRLVDQGGARVGKLGQRGTKVGHLVGDVMHPGATLGQEASNRGVVAERLQQLDPPAADPDRSRANALVVDRRAVLHLRPEQPLVGRQRLVEIADGDAEMVDPPRLHPREATPQRSTRAAIKAAA
jgi:hypothetical protein